MMKRIAAIAVMIVLIASAAASEPQPGYKLADNDNRPGNPIVLGESIRFQVVLRGDFHVRDNPNDEKMIVTLPLPAGTDYQKIIHWEVSPEPVGEIVSKYGYRFLQFELGPGHPGARLKMSYKAVVELRPVRYKIDPARVGSLADIPASIAEDFTGDGPFYQTHSKTVKNAARQAVGTEKNPYLMALKIWNAVRDELFYKGDGRKVSAAQTLKLGHGSCTEYSFTMIAMCRAVGIPARYVAGSPHRVGKGQRRGLDVPMHKVSEVYLPGYGWVLMESSGGDGVYGVDLQEKFFAASSGRMLNFIYEPEPRLVDLDPRRNTITYKPSGAGTMDYYGEITGNWKLLSKTQSKIVDISVESDKQDEPLDEDPSEY